MLEALILKKFAPNGLQQSQMHDMPSMKLQNLRIFGIMSNWRSYTFCCA